MPLFLRQATHPILFYDQACLPNITFHSEYLISLNTKPEPQKYKSEQRPFISIKQIMYRRKLSNHLLIVTLLN